MTRSTACARLRAAAQACAVLCLAGAHTAQAGINVWTSHGPPGGHVRALAIDPSTPGTLYAVIPFNGVFKSTDAGATWAAANTGLPDPPYYVNALAIDPSTPSTLYAGTNGSGVFKSTDAGATWEALNPGLTYPNVNALAIDPATPSTLYAGTGGGVFSLQQVGSCVGDCNDSRAVRINELVMLVNIDLGSGLASACPHGVPGGAAVDIAFIIQAVNNALGGCQFTAD